MSLLAVCAGTISTGSSGEALCSVAWSYVDVADIQATNYTLTQAGAAEIAAAVAVTFAIAWGFRVVARSLFNLK